VCSSDLFFATINLFSVKPKLKFPLWSLFRRAYEKKKAVKNSPPGISVQSAPVLLRDLGFFEAFITQPHHAADLAGRGHHLCRLHGFAAALGNIQVHHGFFCGRFCGFAHFCHVASPPDFILQTRTF
jgi:hypothetical protein